jgi:hypothetical protein
VSSCPYLLNLARERANEDLCSDAEAPAIFETICRVTAYAHSEGWAVAHVSSVGFAVSPREHCFIRQGASAITSADFGRHVANRCVASCYLVGAVLSRPGLATALSMVEFGIPSFVVEGAYFPAAETEHGSRYGLGAEKLTRADLEKLAIFVRVGESAPVQSRPQNIISLESWRWQKKKNA